MQVRAARLRVRLRRSSRGRLAGCSLDEVFQCAGSKKRDFSRRGSSGNWTEDQLTWKEEQSFKRRMGYAAGLTEATPRSAQGGSRT